MNITHLQSSTQIINLGDIKVLTDPWLTDGEYYGSWYHYPPFGDRELSNLEYDFIYVSHIHPDHLSEKTFKVLPYKKPVLVHNFATKFLKRKLEILGYEVIECENSKPFYFDNGGSVTIYAADNCNPELCGRFLGCGAVEAKFGSTQIDSLALFEIGNNAILNTNDCPYELASHTIRANKLNEKRIDLLLVGYAGAGPYPQCFEFDTLDEKIDAARAKQAQFLDQAKKYINLIKPLAFAPFAGTYTLGSRLSGLNDYRGVPPISEATELLDSASKNSTGILLGKLDVYDVASQKVIKNYDTHALTRDEYINQITRNSLDYDYDDWDDTELNILSQSAYKRFQLKAKEINFQSDTKIIIKSDKVAFKFSVSTDIEEIELDENSLEPFVIIEVDHNLLHRLLRGPKYAHWNNAEIGSHLKYIRRPNMFERALYHCMCFFHA